MSTWSARGAPRVALYAPATAEGRSRRASAPRTHRRTPRRRAPGRALPPTRDQPRAPPPYPCRCRPAAAARQRPRPPPPRPPPPPPPPPPWPPPWPSSSSSYPRPPPRPRRPRVRRVKHPRRAAPAPARRVVKMARVAR
eukprot:scaffold76158_cov42-Phaeocystis_antarctica.AAC.3